MDDIISTAEDVFLKPEAKVKVRTGMTVGGGGEFGNFQYTFVNIVNSYLSIEHT
jgi:hypothetical protein